MTLEPAQYLLGAVSGGLVGGMLGLVGGGGSILAVPLMIYLVGVGDTHLAIGTSAVAVAANAAASLASHARSGNVKWRCGGLFALAGTLGALAGSSLGKAMDGGKLLLLFALMMIPVGVVMFLKRGREGDPAAECTREKLPRLLGMGAGAGLFSGFFGIGGGFLIVPALVASTGMPTLLAVGTSLVAVTAFALTVAVSYALSGLLDWPLAATFIAGGLAGSMAGTALSCRLGRGRKQLSTVFAAVVLCVAAYMIWHALRG
ncbi:sulfite exporter TauE/SafE family protein [Altererythrobacter fulvus]|uniref:sulfite exporter TauE/SafE family protein n=1 Tax=Caenibius fulvus TaxID=2126012 RepID=UPI003016F4EE